MCRRNNQRILHASWEPRCGSIAPPTSTTSTSSSRTFLDGCVLESFDGISNVCSITIRIRHDNKKSDDERRERAGDAAMALMNLMNAFGLEEDEKSEASLSDDDDSGVAEN